MKKGLTELVFILDRSGSMRGLENETIGGFNSMIEKQREIDGDCQVTTVLFDTEYELIHDRVDIRKISDLTNRQYYVRGATALLDAVGQTVDNIGNLLKNTAEELRPEKVIFVITTDGEENSSRNYSHTKIKEMIERQQTKYGWTFLFLAANIDTIQVASSIGISPKDCVSYSADFEGVRQCYMSMDLMLKKSREPAVKKDDK